jgi:hypothetical protein
MIAGALVSLLSRAVNRIIFQGAAWFVGSIQYECPQRFSKGGRLSKIESVKSTPKSERW